MRRRPSFTEARRHRLALRPTQVEVCENRNMITESLGIMMLGIGMPGALASLRSPHDASRAGHPTGPEGQRTHAAPATIRIIDFAAATRSRRPHAESSATAKSAAPPAPQESALAADWLTLRRPATPEVATPKPISASPSPVSQAGGGAASGGRGGGSAAPTLIVPLRIAVPPADPSASSSTVIGAASPPATATLSAGSTAIHPGTHPTANTPAASPFIASSLVGPSGGFHSGGSPAADYGLLTPTGGPLGAARMTFTNFPLYTLDYNDGTVFFPGTYQLGKVAAQVDLRAQVRDASVASYSWDTTNLTDATSIAGTSTYNLTFKWTNSEAQVGGRDNSVTLTVTDTNSHTEVQTYWFHIPAGTFVSGGGSGGAATWPTSLPPDLVRPDTPVFATHNASVVGVTGGLETAIALPSYSPNIAGLSLVYDSLAADPRPLIDVHHVIDPTQALPSQVDAALTFNGSSIGTSYYGTSALIAGDILQMGVQTDATALSTGRYGYSVDVADVRTSTTTTTYSGTTTVLSPTDTNSPSSALGQGWSLSGLRRIISATGGVILDLGQGDSLWFAAVSGSGGTTYTSPKGDFSTLAPVSGGGYKRTFPNGTVYNFNSSGYETSLADRDGLTTGYAYDGSHRLTTVTDPYSKVTTFTYSSGYLQSIQDPASRLATFTHSGAALTAVQLPDNARISYAYDGSGRMTTLTDANNHALATAYDAAKRVGTITRADGTSETFASDQGGGFVASSSSGSPASPTLLAEARATHTDPNSHVTDLRPDWRGMGQINQVTDPDGNVSTSDRDSNGLATIVIDRLNRIDQYQYDGTANVTGHTYPDLNSEAYAYNGYSQVTSFTDSASRTTTLAYSGGHSDLIGIYRPDPGFGQTKPVTQFTYTGTGRVQTATDANNNVTTYAYDAQDRLTTLTYPAIGDSSATTLWTYDSNGNAATVTDERGNSTTYSYDAMNRPTGTTDALANRTTYGYDSGGNRTVVQAPTPAGQTARTTSYAYDSMDRLTTLTAPLNAGSSAVTVFGFDSGGQPKTVTDSLGRITTIARDAEDRPAVITTPLTGGSSRVTTTTYDVAGQVLTRVDPPLAGVGNRVTTYAYNSRGWASTVTDPFGNTTTLTYSATGKTLVESNPSGGGSGSGGAGNLAAYTYDNLDRRVAVADALGHLTTTLYDAKDNVTTVTDALSHSTTYAYDARDRLTTVTDALGHATVLGYDSGGNRVTVKDANANTATAQYDAINRATTLTDARTAQTLLTFDEAGRLTVVKDPNGNLTTFGYDAGDRRTTMTTSTATSGIASTTYAYDADGELTDKTDRDGRRVTYSYDSGGRRTGESWVGVSGGLFTSTYDPDGHPLTATDANSTLTYTYNSGGWMTSAATSGPGTGQPSVTLTSGYDASGLRTSLADNLAGTGGTGQGLTTFTYDNAHRLTTIRRSLGGVAGPRVDYSYDNADRVTMMARTIGGAGTEVDSSFAYDNADRLATLTHQVSGGATLATYVYGYDSGDRLSSEADTSGTYTYNATYTYDVADQLTGVSGTNAEAYTYDSGGKRTMTGYATGGDNALTSSPGYTYTYDNEGNLTAKTQTSGGTQVTSYSYDARNRMTGVTIRASGGGSIVHQVTYTYDALNSRIGIKLDNTQTWMVYDGQNTYGDFDATGAVQVRYLYAPAVDAILARTDSGGTSAWYLTDHLGSIRDITNILGTVIDHVAYDSFGTVISESNTANGDRYKFSGREKDAVTQDYYARNRQYNATLGRFLEQDPIEFKSNDSNLYRYVMNSPLDYRDPTGLLEESQIHQQQLNNPFTPNGQGGYDLRSGMRPPNYWQGYFTIPAEKTGSPGFDKYWAMYQATRTLEAMIIMDDPGYRDIFSKIPNAIPAKYKEGYLNSEVAPWYSTDFGLKVPDHNHPSRRGGPELGKNPGWFPPLRIPTRKIPFGNMVPGTFTPKIGPEGYGVIADIPFKSPFLGAEGTASPYFDYPRHGHYTFGFKIEFRY